MVSFLVLAACRGSHGWIDDTPICDPYVAEHAGRCCPQRALQCDGSGLPDVCTYPEPEVLGRAALEDLPFTLAGASVTGSVFIELAHCGDIAEAQFWIDDRNSERAWSVDTTPPHFLSTAEEEPYPLDTRLLTNGLQRVWVEALTVEGDPVALETEFRVHNTTSTGLHVALVPARSPSVPLDGETLSGNAYVFLVPGDLPPIDGVDFYLDDTLTMSENWPPFDLIGSGVRLGTPRPLDVTTLAPGSHTVRADVRYPDNSQSELTAAFVVP